MAALLISLALPVYATAGMVSIADPVANDAAVSAIRVGNFGRVDSTYYRGAQPRGHDYEDLAALGVRAVIDLTKDGDPAEAGMAQRAGMRFFRIPMTTHDTPSAETIALFLRLVNDRANQPVYVHCQGGRHRTGVMTAVYRMSNHGWTADQAFAEMKRYKFGADFLHPEFKRFVYGFHPAMARADAIGAAPAARDAVSKPGGSRPPTARGRGGR